MYRISNHIPLIGARSPRSRCIEARAISFFFGTVFFLIGPRSPIQRRLEAQAISSLIGPRPLMGGGRIEPQTISFLIGGGGRGGYRNSDHIVWAPLPDKEAYRSSSHIGPRLPMRWRIEAQTMSSLIGARSPIMGRSRILAAFHRYLHGSCISSRRTYGPSYTTEASTRHCSKGSTSTGDGTHNTILNQYLEFKKLVSRILLAFYRYLHGYCLSSRRA